MTEWITVAPSADGWMVESSVSAGSMVFFSGALAERAARHLAGCLSKAGVTSVITIKLRDGSIASRFTCPAENLLGLFSPSDETRGRRTAIPRDGRGEAREMCWQ